MIGFPAAGPEQIWRNPRSEIIRFLEEKHPGRAKLFNFCAEPGRAYPAEDFGGRVERYPFLDHDTPWIETLVEFCDSAAAWIEADERNICVLHCKAGKGRAGLMTCCLLLRLGFRKTAAEAMAYYNRCGSPIAQQQPQQAAC